MEKRQKKIQTTTPSNVALSLGTGGHDLSAERWLAGRPNQPGVNLN